MNNYDEQENRYNSEIFDDAKKAKEEDLINYNHIEVKPERKNSLKAYVSLVLVTSVISSSAVGGALYSKFSNELKNRVHLFKRQL